MLINDGDNDKVSSFFLFYFDRPTIAGGNNTTIVDG